MKTVRDILAIKGRDVWHVDAGSTVFEALRLMAEKEIGALVVMDGMRLAGIISERDYARKIVLLGRTSPNTLITEKSCLLRLFIPIRINRSKNAWRL